MLTSVCLETCGNSLAAWNNTPAINHPSRVETHMYTGHTVIQTQSVHLSRPQRLQISINETEQRRRTSVLKLIDTTEELSLVISHLRPTCVMLEICAMNIHIKSRKGKTIIPFLTLVYLASVCPCN